MPLARAASGGGSRIPRMDSATAAAAPAVRGSSPGQGPDRGRSRVRGAGDGIEVDQGAGPSKPYPTFNRLRRPKKSGWRHSSSSERSAASTNPSKANEAALQTAVREITRAAARLLNRLTRQRCREIGNRKRPGRKLGRPKDLGLEAETKRARRPPPGTRSIASLSIA